MTNTQRPSGGSSSQLRRTIQPWDTTLPLISADPFALDADLVLGGEEFVRCTGRNESTLTGCERGLRPEDGGTEARRWVGGTAVDQVPWSTVEITTDYPVATDVMVGRMFVYVDAEGNRYAYRVVAIDEQPTIVWADEPPGAVLGYSAYTLQDEFIGGGASSAAVGELGWAAGGTGSITVLPSTAAHPGLIRVVSGASTGSAQNVNLGPWLLGQIDRMTFIYANNAGGNVRQGAALSTTARVSAPVDGVAVEYAAALSGTHLVFRTWVSSVNTNVISTIPMVALGFVRVELEVTAPGEITATLRDLTTGDAQTHVFTGISQTAQFYAEFFAHTLNNANKSLDVDYWSGTFSGLSRVWR